MTTTKKISKALIALPLLLLVLAACGDVTSTPAATTTSVATTTAATTTVAATSATTTQVATTTVAPTTAPATTTMSVPTTAPATTTVGNTTATSASDDSTAIVAPSDAKGVILPQDITSALLKVVSSSLLSSNVPDLALQLYTSSDAANTAAQNFDTQLKADNWQKGTVTGLYSKNGLDLYVIANDASDFTAASTGLTDTQIQQLVGDSKTVVLVISGTGLGKAIGGSSSTPASTTAATTEATATTTAADETTTAAATATTLAATTPATASAYKIVVGKSEGAILLYDSPEDFNNDNAITLAQGVSPVFSLDGTHVAFIALNTSGDPAANSPIQSVKLDGSDMQTLCTISYNHTNLIRWVPQPNVIEFGTLSADVNTAGACNADNNSPQDSLKASSSTAGAVFDYSPDGKNFLWEELPTASDTFAELYYGSSTAKTGTQLTHGENADSSDAIHSYLDAAISPDGKTIAVASNAGGVFFLSVPGQTSPYANKQIFPKENVSRLAWSPDGKQLLAVMTTDSGSVLKDYDFSSDKIAPYTLADVVFVDWARS